MLIHCTTYDGQKLVINTAHIVCFQPFDFDRVAKAASTEGGITGLVALDQLEKNRGAWTTGKTQIALTNDTTMVVRDDFQSICDKVSLVSEPAIPSR